MEREKSIDVIYFSFSCAAGICKMNLLIGSSALLPFIESRCRAGIYFSHRLGPTDTVAQVETDRMKSLGALTLFSDHCWSIGVTRAPPSTLHSPGVEVGARTAVGLVCVGVGGEGWRRTLVATQLP